MKRTILNISVITLLLLLCPHVTLSQSTDVPKYEVAAEFTSLSLEYGDTLPGLGGRFTYNLNKHLALEAAGYFFPGKCATCSRQITGHVTEGLFGVKAGKRFRRWGVFAKARPGFVSFGKGFFDIVPTGGGGPFPFTFVVRRSTAFGLDVGAVVEFYPSKRIVVRFDGGDTILRYPQRTVHSFTTDPITGALSPFSFTSPAYTRHNFQFSAGVGFRF
jgi:hypothetical protein